MLADSKRIHSTAIVNPRTKVGLGCMIGHYVVVEDNVEIGKNCAIGCGTVIGTKPFDTKYKGEKSFIKIGENNVIREYVTISRTTGKDKSTISGSNNLLGAYVHIGHNVSIGNNTIITNFSQIGGHCEIGDYANIGGMTGIHQFCRVGKYAMVGACSYLTKDIPPYLLGQGNPFKIYWINLAGLKRQGFSAQTICNLKKAFKIIYHSQYNLSDAIKVICDILPQDKLIRTIAEFIQSSKRGIVQKTERRKTQI